MFNKSKLGHSFPSFTITVERCKISELARALGDENPIYHDFAAARIAGYEDIPLPPTAPTLFTFWGNTHLWEQLAGVGINVARILHGEEEYEYAVPIAANDILTGVTTIIDGKSRPSMDIVTTETRYTNQRDQYVLRMKTMFVVRE